MICQRGGGRGTRPRRPPPGPRPQPRPRPERRGEADPEAALQRQVQSGQSHYCYHCCFGRVVLLLPGQPQGQAQGHVPGEQGPRLAELAAGRGCGDAEAAAAGGEEAGAEAVLGAAEAGAQPAPAQAGGQAQVGHTVVVVVVDAAAVVRSSLLCVVAVGVAGVSIRADGQLGAAAPGPV